jgi:uncharacterized membrane protein HdeD (DUF308 family)
MAGTEHAARVAGELRRNRRWILAWGIVLVLAGLAGMAWQLAATVATVGAVALLLVAYGLVEIVHAFRHDRWSGFFLFLVAGLLSAAAGILVWRAPLAGMAVLTLWLSAYFVAVGAFRVIGAASTRHPGWGWGVASGGVGILLGTLIAAEWPASSLWVLGLYVSVSMLVQGWSWVMLAAAAGRAAPAAGGAAHASAPA